MVDEAILKEGLCKTLDDPSLDGYGAPQKGKVRNSYVKDGKRYIVTSDRISAFDRVLGTIPYKGQVLNRVAAFWFEQTKEMVPNHLVDCPDPAVMTVLDCTPMPVEMVVRAYITGSTSTSIWTHYENGARTFCGNPLPEGLKKHQKLEKPILTPSTKAEQGDHDVSVSREEILAMGRITAEDFDTMAKMSMDLFTFGQAHCARQGLILVDTKYEFGKTSDGRIVVIDEVHTPDSSRFWQADTYEKYFAAGENPQGLDKEYVRVWLKTEKNFMGDGPLPYIPDEVKVEAARRYIAACEQITGETFVPDTDDPNRRLARNMAL
ncbi:MAG: phosphoribosylaminoimidazolesuccinocarboxamide synthase [Deltaproteobacteria bacterium]|nr:phosphoribosylaminoimidazolesuccinocarboxamide synthase [Deltaproteobacteria bacterium]MBN2674317.1 phosphoribosylaminoimidazolesuccinocarboxamide synthase [Deltaproteobacteria bacterium]